MIRGIILSLAILLGSLNWHTIDMVDAIIKAKKNVPLVSLDYFVVECQTLPTPPPTASATSIIAVADAHGLRSYETLVASILSMSESNYLGDYNPSWSYWSVRGPDFMRAEYTAVGCTIIEYTDIPTMTPVARRNWLIYRSTCHGEAIWEGRVYHRWPCAWDGMRTGSATTIVGIGPGVEFGGSGYAAATQ